jgi:DNA-binding response OmpR family regulator
VSYLYHPHELPILAFDIHAIISPQVEPAKTRFICRRDRFIMDNSSSKILIVDDAPDFCESLKWLLDYEGYDCTVAFNGKIAIDLLADRETHLILLDWEMPVMSGPEFLKNRNRRPSLRKIPVIVISGASEIERTVTTLGAKYLQKPVNYARLLGAIGVVLPKTA